MPLSLCTKNPEKILISPNQKFMSPTSAYFLKSGVPNTCEESRTCPEKLHKYFWKSIYLYEY
jgi:hypothetical protein